MAVAATSSHSGKLFWGSRCMQIAIMAPAFLGFAINFSTVNCFGLGSFSMYFKDRNNPSFSFASPWRNLNRQGSVFLWVGAQFAASNILTMSALAMGVSVYCAGKTDRLALIISKIIFPLINEQTVKLHDQSRSRTPFNNKLTQCLSTGFRLSSFQIKDNTAFWGIFFSSMNFTFI